MAINAKHMEAKIKHLEIIQGVVNRLANNSFLIKGWAVTLVSAIFALVGQEDSRTDFIYIAFFPIITFWLLDGYFLWQERLFREVYNEVAAKATDQIDFRMNVATYLQKHTWFAATFSKTINIFFGSLLVLTGIAVVIMNK
jgi:hypothetical protein